MSAKSIIVLGDMMLDENLESQEGRLSPEAPVLVVTNPESRSALGGSGNTAANVSSLGARSVAVGLIGNDQAGARIREILKELDIADSLFESATHRTSVKTRFRVGGQQLMRLDYEDVIVSLDDGQVLEQYARGLGSEAAAIIISDYEKGVITHAIAKLAIGAGRDNRIPVIVDSKKTELSCFAGATVIAPNHHEARAATGLSDPQLAAEAIGRVTKGGVVLTMGVNGMLVLSRGEMVHIPSQAREVADVTGAGDTVTAALAVALAEGATLVEAARWATAAAAEAVAHRGTFAVPRSSVREVPEQ